MAGHLFIVRGNLLDLACDALLVPSGSEGGCPGFVTEHWRAELGSLAVDGILERAPDQSDRVVLVRERDTIKRPALWAGFTGHKGDEPVEWYAEAVDEFVRAAAPAARLRTGAEPRSLADDRPLLAVPLIGSGAGGMQADKGSLVAAIVDRLVTAVASYGADVALVLHTAEAFAAAQQARARHPRETTWDDLGGPLESHADRLAGLARADRLVLFLGAGASIGAGLPSWSDLLDALAGEAQLTDAEREELRRLEPRDAGRVLDRRLRDRGGDLAATVVRLVTADRSSLLQQLAASLPVTEAVTTNYDTLFEDAWIGAGREPSVLPWESVAEASCWLLKLHGSVHDPKSIVLSRDDYLRFEGEGVALAGIVQAMLLTRHMLFLGYSLSDDNFHRLVHQVRTAIGAHDQRPGGHFGTALTPRTPSLGDALWDGDVEFVSTAGEDGDDPRRLAILLDRVAALAAPPAAHVLDDTYSQLFSPVENEMREHLLALWRLLEDPALGGATRMAVADALQRIGKPGRDLD